MDGECWWDSRESPEFGYRHVEYTDVCLCSTYVMEVFMCLCVCRHYTYEFGVHERGLG